MAGGFAPFILLALLGDPLLAGPAAGVGLVIRRWWQIAPGSAVPPAAWWTLHSGSEPVGNLLPFLYVAGLVWIAAVFAVKRAWKR